MPFPIPWLTLNTLIGLARVILIHAGFPQIPLSLLAALTLLPVLPVAVWQSRHRRWLPLLCSDALSAGILTALSLLIYSQILLWNVVAVLAFAVIPRGLITEILMRGINLAKGAWSRD
jgi:hypothetical protein